MSQYADMPVQSAVDLWDALIKQGGVHTKSYDKDIVLALVRELRLDEHQSLHSQLKNVSPTSFLIALLSALQPWSQMVSDVLHLFERHGVKSNNAELLVEFDFEAEGLGKLSFDASHFKRAGEAFQQLLSSLHTVSTSDLAMFGLNRALHRELAEAYGIKSNNPNVTHDVAKIDGVTYRSNNPPSSPDARHWFGYRHGVDVVKHEYWPFVDPVPFPPWRSGDPLSSALRPVSEVISSLTMRVTAYSSWEALSVARRKLAHDPAVNSDERASIDEWSTCRLLAAQYDRMSLSLLHTLWLLYDLAPQDTEARMAFAEKVSQCVAKSCTFIDRLEPVRALEQLLALPLWQLRHQLYSVWLVTVVEKAVTPHAAFCLKTTDGILRFSFTETMIASISVMSEELELVAEMRTAAPDGIKLQGKSRVSSVQPDYIIRDRHSRAVKYVLEAKQYRVGAKGNFKRALHDYAAVHDRAFVAIANYGSMPRGMQASIKSLAEKAGTATDYPVVDRCEAIGDVRPGGKGLKPLTEHIARILPPPLPDSIALIIDATSSILNHIPNDGSVPEVWATLCAWSGPVFLVNDSDLIPVSGGRDLVSALRAEAKPVILDLRRVGPNIPSNSLLVTDMGGLREMQSYVNCFCAVVVLLEDGERIWMRMGRGDPSEIANRFFPKALLL